MAPILFGIIILSFVMYLVVLISAIADTNESLAKEATMYLSGGAMVSLAYELAKGL